MPGGLADTIARRLNQEVGAVRKDHGGRLRICLIYPNTYFVGMSSLGFQTVSHLLNSDPAVACERAFLPDPDDLADLARTGSPLVSYESQTPIHQFDVIAFSISYELDYAHAVRVLGLARIPPMAGDRDEHHPLVIAGGAAVSINPEPMADIVDLVAVGEFEPICRELLGALRAPRQGRDELLSAAGEMPGVYVPTLPRRPVVRQHLPDLDASGAHSRILTRETEFGDLFLTEVSRGCGRGCRFCVTPACYWPLRWRSAEAVLRSVRHGMEHRDAVGLIGAAVSDHPEIDEIARRTAGLGARLSVSSLRADSVSDTLLEALARSGARSITLAPEAGSERLRRAIRKDISDDQVLDALRRAAAVGIREAKLYFMVGLPGEVEADVEAIPALVRRCLSEVGLRRVSVAAGAFVPKPHTPYQRKPMLPVRELSQRLREIRESLRRVSRVRLAMESPNWSHLEGALSQGDRRLGSVIVAAEAAGGNLAAWRRALREAALSPDEFVSGRDENAGLPWEFVTPDRRSP